MAFHHEIVNLFLQAAEDNIVEYIPWDFKYYAKLRGNQILEDMQPVIRRSLDATGMFVCPPSSPSPEAGRNCLSDWVGFLMTSLAQILLTADNWNTMAMFLLTSPEDRDTHLSGQWLS